jgi:hypothetical protein
MIIFHALGLRDNVMTQDNNTLLLNVSGSEVTQALCRLNKSLNNKQMNKLTP